LPVVLDGAFDDLGAYGSSVVATQLALVDDVQVIVVTSSDDVANAFSIVGAATRAWPALDAAPQPFATYAIAPPAAAGPVGAAPIVPMCDEHPAKVAAAPCAQCTRGACVDCLVYMPAEAELWCVSCADGARTRNVPLLGNRG
jgi:hypothetical protein